MRGDGPEVEDTRSRVIVRVEGVPSSELERRLAELQEADRLGAILSAMTSRELVESALALPTALLLAEHGPAEGAAGACVPAGDDAARAVGEARAIWGGDAILVADVGLSRHAAMEAGEAGADAVLFRGDDEAVRNCVAWWSQLFVLPVVAEGGAPKAAGLAAAGADFVLVHGAQLIDGSLDAPALVASLQSAERQRAVFGPSGTRETEDDEDQR